MAGSTTSKPPKYKNHVFTSADGTSWSWDERQETAFTLNDGEVSQLRSDISQLSDTVILNDVSGNGIPMGVQVPISDSRLQDFLQFILGVIKFKERLQITITEHAAERLEQDMVNGPSHADYRGWLSEDEIAECVCSIHRVEGARLTVDKRFAKEEQKRFNSPLALEVRGKKKDGSEGTLALAFIEENKVRIITLLKSKPSES